MLLGLQQCRLLGILGTLDLTTNLEEWIGENAWLWQFGRCKPRVVGLSVTDTEDRQITVLQDGATGKRGHAMLTKRTHKAAAAASLRNACCSGGGHGLGVNGYPWYTLSHPKPRIFVLEPTKITHRYLNLEYTKRD
jgi:hypothetical protein